MKILAVSLITILLSFCVYASGPREVMATKISATFKTGNTAELVNYLDENIELVIDSEQVAFYKISSAQAEFILRNFFRKNPANNFRIVYQTGNNNVHNCMGSYETNTENFLVYLSLKQTGSKTTIQKLHLRRDYQR
jgi:hypothetical protein